MLKIGVLGCGRIGRMHAANIAAHSRTKLVGVYDVNAAAAHDVAKTLGVPAFDSAETMFSSELDAILIATATDTHVAYIEQSISAGKAVLCEKPIDLDLKRVNECAANVRGSKLPIMIGFVRRFDPGHRAVRAAIQSGEIGELHQVIVTSRDPGMAPPSYIEISGGIFRDMTIHDFDMARFMLGEEPTEVFATGSRLVEPALMDRLGDWDTITVVLKTASGKQAIINNSRRAVYGYDQRVEAFGSSGMAVSENRRAHSARIFGAGFTDKSEPYLHFFIERYREAFNAEIDAFVDAVEGKSVPAVTFADGRLALVLAEAAMKSIAERRIVNTSEIG